MRFEPKPGYGRELRNSQEVVADLERRAQRIANAAGPGMETRPSETGGRRARVAVITGTFEARLEQSRSRTLEGALGAGRD
jgi:hypothetical protein